MQVNGVTMSMLVDTGASTVVLKPTDAQKLGIDPERLRYSVPVQTANGTTYAAHVRLRTLTLGPIHLTDIELASRGVDWALVAETARRWGLEQAVHFALVLLYDLARVESPGLRYFGSTRLDWAGKAFLAMARRRRWNGLSALGLMSMTREKARFVRETFAPPRTEGLRTRTLMGRLKGAVKMGYL